MNRQIAMLGAALVALGTLVFAEEGPLLGKGKQVYGSSAPKCGACHAVGGQGNPKGSLDGVGSRLTADDMKAWMRTPRQMSEKAKAVRKPPMPAYPKEKLSDEDLEALTAYLLSLKK